MRALSYGVGLALLTALLVPVLGGSRSLLFLGAILVAIGGAFIIERPYLGVLLCSALWFTRIPIVPYLVIGLLVISLGLAMVRDRQVWVLKVPQVKILLAIGLLFLVSIWWNDFLFPAPVLPQIDETWLQMAIFGMRLLWFLSCLYFVTTRRRVDLLAWVGLGMIVAIALSGWPTFLAGEGRLKPMSTVQGGPSRLPYYALFAACLLWLYRSHGQSRRFKKVTLPVLILLPASALASGSRGALVMAPILAILVLWEQKGWSAARRMRSVIFVGSLAVLMGIVVPATQVLRATTFDPTVVGAGQHSLKNRLNSALAAVDMALTNPIVGSGIGNFVGVKRALYGIPLEQNSHNAYLWAATSGGMGAVVLYVLLLYVTYRMLRTLESSGPREWVWLSKGLRINLILLALYSATNEVWLSNIFYLHVGLSTAMFCVWVRDDTATARRAVSMVPRKVSGVPWYPLRAKTRRGFAPPGIGSTLPVPRR